MDIANQPTPIRRYKPLHILDGEYGEWERWFAWRPVRSEQRKRIWMRHTWRRHFLPPIWFIPPAPASGWFEYSDDKTGFWDHHEHPHSHTEKETG